MDILNEEKAKEIATKWKAYGLPYNAIYETAIEVMEWKEQQLTDKVYEAYCKVCGHFAHTTPIETHRQYCQHYENFKQIIKE